ncbi:hypothetical protein AAVH_37367 [Aphelenchoides avenae]|nr:hypothetical protein AAVH_37367 [Aphelenchus avenae]
MGQFFQITSSQYPHTGANEPVSSKWYKMTLRFYPASRKTGDTPRALVSSSLPMDTPPGTYKEWPETTKWISRKAVEEPKHPADPSQARGTWKGEPVKREWKAEATESSAVGAEAVPKGVFAGNQAKVQTQPSAELPYSGVVCYKEDGRSYVYSDYFEREAIFDDPTNTLRLGEWIVFYAVDNDEPYPVVERYEKTDQRHRTVPLGRSVALECSIIVSRYDPKTRLVRSDFAPQVLDVYGLVGEGRRGMRDATITYVYEEGASNGYWRLDYVHPEEAK